MLPSRGSKSSKMWFYQSLFSQESHLLDYFANLQERKVTDIIQCNFRKEFNKWKHINAIMVTACNQLLELYNIVCLS